MAGRKGAKKKPVKLKKDLKDPQIDDQEEQFLDPYVEQQSAAIRAMRDVEIVHLLTEIRLLRSYFNHEQLQAPCLKFFEDNFPDLSVVKHSENGRMEIQWKTYQDKVPVDITRDSHASLLHRLSMARSDFSAPFSTFGKTQLFAPDYLRTRDVGLEESSQTHMLGMQDAFQTPGMSNHRLSIGMTPKTLRVPKAGEMLLSVDGSPLGVYKEDSMEAICESEES